MSKKLKTTTQTKTTKLVIGGLYRTTEIFPVYQEKYCDDIFFNSMTVIQPDSLLLFIDDDAPKSFIWFRDEQTIKVMTFRIPSLKVVSLPNT